MPEPYYNNGVGHAAFIAAFTTAGNVTLEDFNPEFPSAHIIDVPTVLGANQDVWVGISGGPTASATAQTPVAAGTATIITKGDSFTAPATHGGLTWVVTHVAPSFRVGDYWKTSISLKKSV